MPAACRRRCSSARRPCARCCAAWCPRLEVITRPRFSTLSYTGPRKKLTRLPPRSAVVAFSAADVYRLAEAMRRQHGGCAVVMGALSPRTRNAQVEMYQAGEVDHLVATDAIGMGLNMDLDHVAFAELAKFDGRGPRRLSAAELAQIAGRAGRHMNDGSFGTTAEVGAFDARDGGGHRESPLRCHCRADVAQQRARFPLRSRACCEPGAPPPDPVLLRVREADDQQALNAPRPRSRDRCAASAARRRCACSGRSARSPTSARS